MPKDTFKKSLREKGTSTNNRRRLEKSVRQMLSGELNFPGSVALAVASHHPAPPYRRIVE